MSDTTAVTIIVVLGALLIICLAMLEILRPRPAKKNYTAHPYNSNRYERLTIGAHGGRVRVHAFLRVVNVPNERDTDIAVNLTRGQAIGAALRMLAIALNPFR